MKIVATYDSTVASAPAGYKTAIQSAVAFFETTFSDNITINITFNWKSLFGGIAQSETYYNSYDYSTVIAALKIKATSSDDLAILARLPKTDPLSNSNSSINYNVSSAEAKALGLANSITSDGTVTLGSGYTYAFDPNKRAIAGSIDAIGVLEHEISEIMSRSCGSDGAYYKTVFGLCRYSSPGVLNASASYKNAYFSIDGKNMLQEIGEVGGDLGDWAASVKGDACGYASTGTQLTFSDIDIRSMDAIGYTVAGVTSPSITSPSITTPSVTTPAGTFTNTPVPATEMPFNALDYIASYTDLIKAFGTNAASGASHWQSSGQKEGRKTTFNGLDYIASYSDLIKAFGVNEQAGATHFIQNGLNEKRTTTFKGLDYIASYGDLIKAFGVNEQAGATHFIQNGLNEKRSVTFDGLAYIAQYSDLMKAFGANSEAGAAHYIINGINEKRKSSFDIAAYKAAHSDLAAKYSTNESFLTAYINTFAITGNQLI